MAMLCSFSISLTAQNMFPDWYGKDHHYTVPDNYLTEGNFTMLTIGTIDGVRCDNAYELGIFCKEKNECRCSEPFYTNRLFFDQFGYYATPTVNGVSGETFYFRLYDHRNQVEVEAEIAPKEVAFVDNQMLGDFDNFYELAFKNSTTHRNSLIIDDATGLPFTGKQYGITADGIACSYTRNAYLDGGYETIVLPFDADITSIKAAGFVFEKFEGFGDNTIKFIELDEAENLQAGVPYLFRYSGTPSAGRQEIEFVAAMDQVDDKIIAMQGWTGTFKRMEGNEIAGKYILNTSGNKMVKAGTGAGLKPYHAYLNLPEGVDATALAVSHRSATTDVDEVLQENVYGEEIMFDLSGRRVKHPSAGDVIIKNNKKMYVR